MDSGLGTLTKQIATLLRLTKLSSMHPHRQPSTSNNHHHVSSIAQQSLMAAAAMRSALTNPYASTYSSHYAQAYLQHSAPAPLTTPEGFTFSSTYNPHNPSIINNQSRPVHSQFPRNPNPTRHSQPSTSWYQPGNSRCTYKQCTFSGSAKSVEIHMADRHLIHPKGWEQRNKGSDWDADPSLKGYVLCFES